MGREPTRKEEERLDKELEQERKRRKRLRINQINTFQQPVPQPKQPIKEKPPVVNVNLKFYNPAVMRHMPQPTWCPLCRGELDTKPKEGATPQGTVVFYKCTSCHNHVTILIGTIVGGGNVVG